MHRSSCHLHFWSTGTNSSATTGRWPVVRTITTGTAAREEQLGGYYIVEAKDLDEAIEFAAGIPSATMGSIEVRPVMVFE